MKSARKISAFAAFSREKKDKFQVTDKKDVGTVLKKSSSEPVVNTAGEEPNKEPNLLPRKLKGGSMRGLRDKPKLRASFLPDSAISESPLVPAETKPTAKASPRPRRSLRLKKGQVNKTDSLDGPKQKKAKVAKAAKQANAKNAMNKLNGTVKGRKQQSTEPLKDEVIHRKRKKVEKKPLPVTTEGPNTEPQRFETTTDPVEKKPLPVTTEGPNTEPQRFETTTDPLLLEQAVERPLSYAVKHVHVSLPCMYDSAEDARELFECIIHPVTTTKFFSKIWEEMPLLVRRHIPDYNKGWFSTQELDQILRKETIKFGENLDITTYENGCRETHNPSGRAHAPVVWDYYQNGCSVSLLNPQTYSDNVWQFLSTLQEYFGCCVGANIYLTPAGTQGFAPHFDDIEAFVLQLEGRKHWKLYNPRDKNEKLPRFSSDNFDEEDVGIPILDAVVEAGDLLYFPRGFIHQAFAMEDSHSLHITVSCYQKNTWGDFLEKLVPRAIQVAMEEDPEFRTGLPRDYLRHMGVANCDVRSETRDEFLKKIEKLMTKLLCYAPVDAACDQMGKQYIDDSLPPQLTTDEKTCSIHGDGERWSNGCVIGTSEIEPDTQIKLIRRGALRLVTEGEDQIHVYHCLENSRVYHGHEEPQYIDVTPEIASAVEHLIRQYPDFMPVDDLPVTCVQERVNVARVLYEKGLLRTKTPLVPLDDDENCLAEDAL